MVLSAMMLLSFWILILTVLMHVIYIRKTLHNIIRHENSMLLLANRFFVLKPLSELAPYWMHPVLHRTVAQLLADNPEPV